MKHTLKTFSIAVVILSALAVGTQAYTNPNTFFPGDNKEFAPIHEGAKNQSKKSGLSVGTFQAKGDAWIMGQTFFQGSVRGDRVTAPTSVSTVRFGIQGQSTVSIDASSSVYVGDRFQSDTLAHQSGESGQVCADATGKLILCR